MTSRRGSKELRLKKITPICLVSEVKTRSVRHDTELSREVYDQFQSIVVIGRGET